MAEWKQERLGDHAQIRARIGWRGLPASEYVDRGPFLVAAKHIESGSVDWARCDHLTVDRYRESPEIALRVGDVIVSKDGTIGRTARIDTLPGPATLNGTMMLARSSPSLDYRYLSHLLNGTVFKSLVDERVSGSSIPHLFQRDLVSLPISVPPLEEQRRIAEVLDSVDDAIRSSERVIAKLAYTKRGSADHLLKSLPLNSSLAVGLQRIDAGWSPSCVDRPPLEQEWGVLKVSSITTETFDPSESKTLPTTLRHCPELAAEVGDVLTARANGVADLVARTAIVDDLDHKNLMISDKTLRLVPGPALSAGYLTLCMQHEMVRSQVRRLVAGSTGQGNISQEELLSLRIAIQEFRRQMEIEQAITAMDARIRAEKNHCQKLRQVRVGLAEDLLSGRVRTVAA